MLEKLFTSKNRIKILNFFLFEEQESYIREVSRALKISVSAVKKEIDSLNSIGLLNINKNKISLNNSCSYLEDLKNLFVKTDAIYYPIKKALNDKRIKFALIFGSFASGEYRKDSDIDLMIIGDISLNDIIKIIRVPENKIKKDINPIVWTNKNLKKEKESGFVRDIFAKKIIMIKGDENELREIIK